LNLKDKIKRIPKAGPPEGCADLKSLLQITRDAKQLKQR